MVNLTDKPEFDGVTNCNGLPHYKNQNYKTNSSTLKFQKKISFYFSPKHERGLTSNKLDELFVSLLPKQPHIICLRTHNLRNNEIDTIALTRYSLGGKFSRNTIKNGGVCIFTYESIQFTYKNLYKFCKEKYLEVCTVKLHLSSCEICIITYAFIRRLIHT
jgi:hypothetical protein